MADHPCDCKSILIVEDDRDIRETLQLLLELEGYKVWSAANGKEGLIQLKELERPCLILLDLMMPVMNGWEFLDAQKEDVALATIPVIVVSAAGDKTKTPPVSAFVKKPIDINVLIDTVSRYCQRPAAAA